MMIMLEQMMMMGMVVMMIGLLGLVQADPKGYGDYDIYDDIGSPYSHNVLPVKKVEYYSKPKYAFGYEVDGLDHYFNELSHGRWEIRDGDVVQGQYRVLLPDGRIQIVSYIADKFGYRPTIQYINKGAPPPLPPAYANVKIPHFVEPVHIPPPPPVVHEEVFHSPEQYVLNPGPILPPFAQYGAGYGYYGDPFLALGSTNGQAKVAKKRALLYDRTLFRKDVERPRRSNKNKRQIRIVKKRVITNQGKEI